MSDLVERLKAACTHLVDGVSSCPAHQVHNRCLTCQAADVIERTVPKLSSCLERLDIRHDEDGGQHDEIDRLQFTLEQADYSLEQSKVKLDAVEEEAQDEIYDLQSRLDKICRIAHGDWGINAKLSMDEIYAIATGRVVQGRAAVSVKERYDKHFGSDAFVPGYCGKCPGAKPHASFRVVCGILDGDTRVNKDSEPPEWCPVRHISTRYTTAVERRVPMGKPITHAIRSGVLIGDPSGGPDSENQLPNGVVREHAPSCKVCKGLVGPNDMVYRRLRRDGCSDIWHENCAPWHRDSDSEGHEPDKS